MADASKPLRHIDDLLSDDEREALTADLAAIHKAAYPEWDGVFALPTENRTIHRGRVVRRSTQSDESAP